MKEFLEIIQVWGGIILLLVLAVIGIIFSLAGSSSAEERRLNGKDDDHYVLRLPISRVGFPLALLVAGVILLFVCNILQGRFFSDQVWIAVLIKLAVAVIFGLLFWVQLAKVLRRRVFVNGDRIIVTPAIGAPIETNYKQIRTVANIHAGKDRGVIGKKIRTKEGNRFEVINTMAGYDRFCEQLSEKVELPDLTKKLFKKRDKKVTAEPEPAESVSVEPLPDASLVTEMPKPSHAKHDWKESVAGFFRGAEPEESDYEETVPEAETPEPLTESVFAADTSQNSFEEDVTEESAPETADENAAEENIPESEEEFAGEEISPEIAEEFAGEEISPKTEEEYAEGESSPEASEEYAQEEISHESAEEYMTEESAADLTEENEPEEPEAEAGDIADEQEPAAESVEK